MEAPVKRTRDTGMRDREYQEWKRKEHYLNYPLIQKEKIPDGYLQYWDEDDLCYRIAPAAEADRYGVIMPVYPKSNNFMEDETVVVPEVVADETAEVVVESPEENTEEAVVEPEAV